MALYFAFGANMHAATLQRRGIETAASWPGRVRGYRLVFDNPAIPLLEPAFASISRSEDDDVWGVVFEMSDRALRSLGGYEGHQYREVGVEVEFDGSRRAARTFVTNGVGKERLPSRRYLSVLVDAAREHDLPDSWIARLESHPSLYVPGLHEAWALCFRQLDRVRRHFVRPATRE